MRATTASDPERAIPSGCTEAEAERFAQLQVERIRQLTRIGIALSSQKDINSLLEMILEEARTATGADAGTLYIVNEDKTHLNFMILENDTMGSRMGGTSGVPVTLPPVPLYVNGEPNHANVSSHVAISGEIVNIPDVYVAEGFDFTGPRKYDAATGYRSKSMLVMPMRNHLGDMIGVLQLLNAKDPITDEVREFAVETADMVESLASQAAVALTQAQLIQDLKDLFNAFIKSIATAIDQKSPYTGGHINRVVDLSMMLAESINAATEGVYAGMTFSDDQMEELRLSAWLHDVGKITTPEYVVDKRNKLETIFDRSDLLRARFAYIAARTEADLLRRGPQDGADLEAEIAEATAAVTADLEFILACNQPGEFMDDAKIERLNALAQRTYRQGSDILPWITPDELKNLCIRKGSLTAEERRVIENHATMTIKILSELPFPRRLAQVPALAGAHHEKLDGSGYPLGLKAEQIPIQARIMAVADIFEALTARDRPYKKPMKLSQAVKILGFMVKDGHIDKDLYDYFINSGLYLEYARKCLGEDQIDVGLT